jgi:succinate dehydrogenase / fumarate reductase cytochrome b subunit
MSSAATTKPQSFLERNHLLLRRLHSLTGIVPIGVFLIAHLVTNSSILWGKVGMRQAGHDMTMVQGGVTYFQKEVQWINEQVPHLLLIEITLWTALAYHSILGFYYARTGRTNVAAYAYQSNWRYTLQRISGYFGILFIIYHIGTLRWGWSFLTPGGTTWSHEFAASTMALALRGGEDFTAAGIAVSLFYLVSVSLLVFHFANGLWTAAITWGLTISQTAQKRWGYVCAGLGAGLMLAAWSSVVGFATLSPEQAKNFELEYHKKYGAPGAVEKLTKPVPAPSTGAARESVPVQGQ